MAGKITSSMSVTGINLLQNSANHAISGVVNHHSSSAAGGTSSPSSTSNPVGTNTSAAIPGGASVPGYTLPEQIIISSDGVLDGVDRGDYIVNQSDEPAPRGCTDSANCASGEACVDGKCVKQDPTTPAGQTDGCGLGAIPAPGSGCSEAGCSDTFEDIYGEFGGAFGRKCTSFCDDYLKANGETAASCKTNTGYDNACDSCTFCGESGTCEFIVDDETVCQCPQSKCGNCFKCKRKKKSRFYGQCRKADHCKNCCEIKGGECLCGTTIDIAECGRDKNPYIMRKCHKELRKRCDEVCGDQAFGLANCHCHDDCGPCRLCGTNGRCGRDPTCDDTRTKYGNVFTVALQEVDEGFVSSYNITIEKNKNKYGGTGIPVFAGWGGSIYECSQNGSLEVCGLSQLHQLTSDWRFPDGTVVTLTLYQHSGLVPDMDNSSSFPCKSINGGTGAYPEGVVDLDNLERI